MAQLMDMLCLQGEQMKLLATLMGQLRSELEEIKESPPHHPRNLRSWS